MLQAAYVMAHPPLAIPEIGRGEERKIPRTMESYRHIAEEIAKLKPETIVLISPHAPRYSDYFHLAPGKQIEGNLSQFGFSKDFRIALDQELVEGLIEDDFPAGTQGQRASLDHAALVPLYFILEQYQDFNLVLVSQSGLSPTDHVELGRRLDQRARELGRNYVLIASGDLSHRLKEEGPYGFHAQGPRYDAEITRLLEEGDFLSILTMDPLLCEQAGECGQHSFYILAGVLDGYVSLPRLLSYEGVFGVGYGMLSYTILSQKPPQLMEAFRQGQQEEFELLRKQEDPLVALARKSLEHQVTTGKALPLPEDLPEDLLQRKAGAFVTLKKQGRLRGCIGTIQPTCESLAQEIMRNAVESGLRDSRFPLVSREELPELVYSVDVLHEPELIESEDQLDPLRYGVIVEQGYRKGLLLPGIEGVDSVQEQLSIAKQKAGIGSGSVKLYRFLVERHQ